MTDTPEAPKRTARDLAELLLQMTKEAKRIERRLSAEACVVIAIFKEGDKLIFQDAGRFPMPPDHFYNVMVNAHQQGLMGTKKSKIIKPN